jgi:YegS/Rv2252/BmrU family lipid kinase
MAELCVILNPHAGRGRAGRRQAELEQALCAAALDYRLHRTRQRGDAAKLAYQELQQGCDTLAVVGGDGSINEVVNALLHHAAHRRLSQAQAALGIVPVGTGSDFIKSLEGFTSDDIGAAVDRLAAKHTRRIDAGRVQVVSDTGEHTHFFINNLALGIDAAVAAESQRVPYLTGTASYMAGAVRALLQHRIQPMTVRYADTELRRTFLLATVANGRCQGGGFWLTPDASLDDGLLDMCLVDRLRPDQIVHYLPRAMRGKHTRLPRVQMARASHITVEYTRPALIVTDGEVVATAARRLTVDVLPAALALLV